MIKFFQVTKSSQVESIGHDSEALALYVKFKSGGLYRYEGVTGILADRFLRAESYGKFLADEIKGVFPFTKVPIDHPAWATLAECKEVFVR